MDDKALRKQSLMGIITSRTQETPPPQETPEQSPRESIIQTIREQFSANDWVHMKRAEREIFTIRSLTLATIATMVMEPNLYNPITNLKDIFDWASRFGQEQTAKR